MVGRFLIGSSLLFLGSMVMLTAAVTVVGLPLGLILFAAGLELLVGGGRSRSRTGRSEAR
jgi:hypothetical protein